jgi:hypothetical protein
MRGPALQISVEAVGGHPIPSAARPAGYAALIAAFGLEVPAPDELVAIGERHTYRQVGCWRILTPRYAPAADLAGHIEFALRHEGVDLGVLSALFQRAPAGELEAWIRSEPTGQYARRTWFLFEWLTGRRLDLPDAPRAPYVGVIDPLRQFAVDGETVTRQRVRNNLPGTRDFCPLVRRTPKLETVVAQDLALEARSVAARTTPDLVTRAAAFMLLADSRASYVIEGERPPLDRVQRWGRAIGEAGQHPMTKAELLRLQRIVIGDARFIHLGFRNEGGFIGGRDRDTNAPIPEHLSARPEDLQGLLDGLVAYVQRAEAQHLQPIVAAAAAAFGFVFIHPFEDGNGRIHRWMVHHVLARNGFSPPGLVFPVSAVILERLDDYRRALEDYSRPRLALTRWETTPDLNVRVLSDTAGFFRYFDATRQAEFLAECVSETVRNTLPREIDYLRRYDLARRRVEAFLELPDAKFDLLMGFLRQNDGHLSQRARREVFAGLTDEEARAVEDVYRELLDQAK